MEILGDRKFVDVPGSKTHELPPLLLRGAAGLKRMDRVMQMASGIVESEDLLADPSAVEVGPMVLEREQRRMDLAINLVEQYLGLVMHWQWGDDVIEWIRQCETTFGQRIELRNLINTGVWPHAGRSSFGLRLTFRQPPPLKCFSNQFLFYLNSTVANTAYQTWEAMSHAPVSSLPPER